METLMWLVEVLAYIIAIGLMAVGLTAYNWRSIKSWLQRKEPYIF